MATNLLLGYPQITLDADLAVSSAFHDLRPAENAIYGGRSELAQLDAADTTVSLTFDLGSSQQKTIDFLYVARANLLKAHGATRLLLEGSDDDSAYTDICGVDGGFQSLALHGPRGEDAIFTSELANSTDGALSASPTYRYWRFWGADAADPSEKWSFSKVMFGQWFDFGRDPLTDRQVGITRTEWSREGAYRLTLRWRGLSRTVYEAFVETFIAEGPVSKIERGLFLYTSFYHEFLFNWRVLHCMVVDYEPVPAASDTFDLNITFEELV